MRHITPALPIFAALFQPLARMADHPFERNLIMRRVLFLLCLCVTVTTAAAADQLLIEAESFTEHGGWKLDTQFIDNMGSPYLLAHGLGRQVKDAATQVTFPSTGMYHVFVRTKDWTAPWGAKGSPGRFQILIDGQALKTTFGTQSAKWAWQAGGQVNIANKKATLALRDLTGFNGRCDAIYFAKDSAVPPNDNTILPAWRRKLLGLSDKPTQKAGYDLVVIGGGYSGMGAALSAARMGCKVALIQNRPVLGGNGSSEVRVWAQGLIRRGRFPRIGEIVEEFADRARKSPGTYEEFGDKKKLAIVQAEKNIDLFLNHHAYRVDVDPPVKLGSSNGKKASGNRRITAVYAFDTRTSEHKQFIGKLYVDCTGHGTVGYLASADWDMTAKGRMGMSNMWAWAEGKETVSYPDTSAWALDLNMKDFPYPRDHHGQWFWESGFDKDPIGGAELIRDWNLRAVYGAFNAMKNRDGADKHKTAYLTWVAFIGGPRESRQLLGDVILTQDDIVNKRQFPDGCVPSTWSIDLHYPKKQYAVKFPDNPFISIAKHDRRVDRAYGYPVPYRSFYSRNISNLFMAGRCISVTHEALGTVRVMKTCGMMGEVVGKAASICTIHDCEPRDVYKTYWNDMEALLELPGKARRATVRDVIIMPANVPPAHTHGPPSGVDPAKLPGIVVDDRKAMSKQGPWREGQGLKGYIGHGYLYAGPSTQARISFVLTAPTDGRYDVRINYQTHKNRATNVPVRLGVAGKTKIHTVNMRKAAPIKGGWYSLGTYELKKDESVMVSLSAGKVDGNVHADAVQLLPVK